MGKINSQFKEWACSLSGCDGGNPQSPIWLCGIEWGYAKNRGETDEEYGKKVAEYYSDELPDEISRGKYSPKKKFVWSEHLAYPFGISAAKLFMALNGYSVKDYSELASKYKDLNLFKLNLYPIAFRYTGYDLWEKYSISKYTGLDSKDVYRAWCFINRFPAISEEVRKYSPKIIIGVGISYLVDFFTCFAAPYGTENIYTRIIQAKSANDSASRTYYWSRINEGKTILAVVPFFSSRYGLNSNELLQQVGNEIFELRKSIDPI